MRIANTLPELIGRTPLLRLERFAPGAGLLAKLESFNPLSSAKDRAGLYMIRDAEERSCLFCVCKTRAFPVFKMRTFPRILKYYPGL